MTIVGPKGNRQKRTEFRSVQQLIEKRKLTFTEQDLAAALDDQMSRVPEATVLAPEAQLFWERHSGISGTDTEVRRATASSAAARMIMDSSALTATEVAKSLNLSESTVRHYKGERKLYAYSRGAKSFFPRWQFNTEGSQVIPALSSILAVLGDDVHPQTVAGFFLNSQADLVIDGIAVPPKAWLEKGGSAGHIVDLARDLATGL